MIGYTTVGTNNIVQATEFYDAIFSVLNAEKAYEFDRFVGWQCADTGLMFAVVKPFDGKAATHGNGVMVALNVKQQGVVEQLHAKALALGGVCEGAPGIRQEVYFCGYCRDLDGNKLNFYCQL